MESTPAWRSSIQVRPAPFIAHRQRANTFTTRTFYLESRVSSLTVSPEPQINIEPQDDDSILMALHEEGSREEHERPPQPEPQSEPRASPQPEPKLRRSARIKAKKQEPKVKTPGKSTSRKRAVRKK